MTFPIAGHVYSARVDIAGLRRVKALTGVDLIELVRGQLAAEMANDPVQLCVALWALIKPQADANGLTEEAFYEHLAGDVLAEATNALLEGVVDFFPKRHREVLRAALAKSSELREAVSIASKAKIEAIDTDKLTQKLLAKSGEQSSSAQESSESTPPG